MKKILIVLSLLLFVGCSNHNYQNINARDAVEKINSGEYLILDVRSNLEFSNGHIDDSVNVNLEDIEKYITEVITNKERKIIVYCQSGRRSVEASKKLIDLGYKNIYNLVGGIQAFEEENK